MPEANSEPILSNSLSRYPRITPAPAQKPKLLDRLGMDYLLTWNCKHLANAQVVRRVAAVCNREGYDMPVICTPEELMGE
jgi:hypothetical protein